MTPYPWLAVSLLAWVSSSTDFHGVTMMATMILGGAAILLDWMLVGVTGLGAESSVGDGLAVSRRGCLRGPTSTSRVAAPPRDRGCASREPACGGRVLESSRLSAQVCGSSMSSCASCSPKKSASQLVGDPADDTSVAMELKYLTDGWSGNVGGEAFHLLRHSAQDIRAYDCVKDIGRVETLVRAGYATSGLVIVLANDPSYCCLARKVCSGTCRSSSPCRRRDCRAGRTLWFLALLGRRAPSGQVKHTQDHDTAVGVAEDVENDPSSGVELGAPAVGNRVVVGVVFRVGRQRAEPLQQSRGDVLIEGQVLLLGVIDPEDQVVSQCAGTSRQRFVRADL